MVSFKKLKSILEVIIPSISSIIIVSLYIYYKYILQYQFTDSQEFLYLTFFVLSLVFIIALCTPISQPHNKV